MTPRPLNRLLIHLLLQLASVTHVGAVLILANRFDPLVALGSGVLLGAAVGWVAERRVFSRCEPTRAGGGPRRRWGLLLVLAVAAACRLDPAVDFGGDGDPGIAANLAVHLTHSESLSHHDQTLTELPADGRYFLETLRPNGAVRLDTEVLPGFRGLREGRYLPGVDVAEAATVTYVFGAPPAQPVWLAIGAALTGPDGVGLVTSLFGLLAVVCLHQLILVWTRRELLAWGVALLLAIAPVVPGRPGSAAAEPVWLAFLLGSLLALFASRRLERDQIMRRFCAGLTVGGFSAFSLCVGAGFVLLPGLAAGALWAAGRPGSRRLLNGTLMGLLAVSGLAVVAGYAASFPYAFETSDGIFRPLLGEAWNQRLPWLVVVALGVLFKLMRIGGGQADEGPAPAWRRSMGVLALTLLGLGTVFLLAGGGRFDDRGTGVPLADLERAVASIGRNDLLVLDERDLDFRRMTLPLVYALDRNVWSFADRRRLTQMCESAELLAGYRSVLVVSRQTDLPAWFEPAGLLEIGGGYLAGGSAGSADELVALPLHRLDIARLDAEIPLYPGTVTTVTGVHGGGWTGPRAVLTFDLEDPDRDRLRIVLRDWGPQGVRGLAPRVSLSLNGRRIEPSLVTPERIICPLPQGLLVMTANELVIEAETFVPREIDPANSDPRELGVNLETVTLR